MEHLLRIDYKDNMKMVFVTHSTHNQPRVNLRFYKGKVSCQRSSRCKKKKNKIIKLFSRVYYNKYEQIWFQKFKLMALLFRYPIC